MATLVIMAAGMGSRYGGPKQIDPIGPHGEILMEYTVYDAMTAGFDKVVFILQKAHVDDFKQLYGAKMAKYMEVAYAVQDLNDLPEGYIAPKDRVKPWGTAHAVYCARKMIHGPFCVINADDFYGRDAFEQVHHFLHHSSGGKPYACCMAGYRIENTLTENGHVSRGVCSADETGMLTSIRELTEIKRIDGKITDVKTGTPIEDGTPVSMNVWGFPGAVLDDLEGELKSFLGNNLDSQKGEFYLPGYVDSLLKSQAATVRVLDTATKWYGITYREDKAPLQTAVAEYTREGLYPDCLFP